MHRCGSGFLLSSVITFVVALTGCLGKSSINPGGGGVKTVTLNPGSNFSIDVGGTQIFSASGTDASGRPVLGASIQFIVESGSPNASAPLSVAPNGSACAGTWDPTATICTAGTPGIALVRAVIQGVSSPTTTVYVHQHIDSIRITQAETQPPQYDCFSQGQTWQFQGMAFSNNVDITKPKPVRELDHHKQRRQRIRHGDRGRHPLRNCQQHAFAQPAPHLEYD